MQYAFGAISFQTHIVESQLPQLRLHAAPNQAKSPCCSFGGGSGQAQSSDLVHSLVGMAAQYFFPFLSGGLQVMFELQASAL